MIFYPNQRCRFFSDADSGCFRAARNSYRLNLNAKNPSSERTTSPKIRSRSGVFSLMELGQSASNSICVPTLIDSLVSTSTPELLMFRVRPVPDNEGSLAA